MTVKKAWVKLQGIQQIKEVSVDTTGEQVMLDKRQMPVEELNFDVPINGTVYGTLLNYKGSYEELEPLMNQKPYQEPPKAPILYIKPINTLTANKSTVLIPETEEALQIGPSLGIVIGKTACKVHIENASDYIKGFVIANDIRIPHKSVYRPAIKEIARDGFCPIGPWVIDCNGIKDPNNVVLKVYINNQLILANSTANLIRPVEKLLSEVTSFMTLSEGDVLLTGIPENTPLVKKGDVVVVEIEGIGKLKNTFS